MTWCKRCKHNPGLEKEAKIWRPFILFYRRFYKIKSFDELSVSDKVRVWKEYVDKWL